MKAAELIAEFKRCGPQDLNVALSYIAERLYDSRLADGRRILDAMDMKQFLDECAVAYQNGGGKPLRFHNVCPDCGHEHIDEKRCNFPYAQDRECQCERKVTA
jgi:hypothetical protein